MRVRIRQGVVTDDAEIFVFEEIDRKTYLMQPEGESFRSVHIPEAAAFSDVKPTFKIPGQWRKKFWQELVNEIDRTFNVIPESEEGLKGRLEATGKHLEDMRHLVFKTRP